MNLALPLGAYHAFRCAFSPTVTQTQPNPPSAEKKEPAKPVDWGPNCENTHTGFLGEFKYGELAFDMHIPSVLGYKLAVSIA